MKSKAAYKFCRKETQHYRFIIYIAFAILLACMEISIKFVNMDNLNINIEGGWYLLLLLAFIPGLNACAAPFKMLIQNSVGRKTYFKAMTRSILVFSLEMSFVYSVFEESLSYLSNNVNGINIVTVFDMVSSYMGDNRIAVLIIGYLFLFTASMMVYMLGYLAATLFYIISNHIMKVVSAVLVILIAGLLFAMLLASGAFGTGGILMNLIVLPFSNFYIAAAGGSLIFTIMLMGIIKMLTRKMDLK